MSIQLAHRVTQIQPSATLAISARANKLKQAGQSIINLSLGEPDFPTPDFIKAAGIDAINNNFSHYTPVDGLAELKQAIIQKFKRDNQLDYQLEHILVSAGAKHSIYNLLQALINPGDEVIIPAPYWVSYPDMVKLAGGVPNIIEAPLSKRFKIQPEQLEQAITAKTRLLFLNSPCNPTGMAYSKKELQALAQVLHNHPQVLIASDDIYEHVLWSDEPFCNLAMVASDLYARTIVINGVSKIYAMTGWRIGYAAGDATLIAAMKKIQSQATSNPCAIAQKAAEAALMGDQSCIQNMVATFKQRHDAMLERLQQLPGIQATACDGAFYFFIDVIEAMAKLKLKNDIEFAEHLLNKAGVAVVPGTAFGSPGHIRLSYATDMDSLNKAMDQIERAL